MDRRDQELLDTQMKRFQPPSRRDGLMILAIVGVFLAGMTAGASCLRRIEASRRRKRLLATMERRHWRFS